MLKVWSLSNCILFVNDLDFLYVYLENIFFGFFFFLTLHVQHMEIFRLGVKSELPAYATATAMQDLSHICNLHHSSQQCWMLNPLSKARDWTHNLTVPSRIRQPLSHKRNSDNAGFSTCCTTRQLLSTVFRDAYNSPCGERVQD